MKDFVLELIAAVGGALGITLIFLTFTRGIIQKWLEAIIDKTAEKGIAKYSDTLQRQTRAYEMLLQKNLVSLKQQLLLLVQQYLMQMTFLFI